MHALEAPGVPIQFSYVSKVGPLTFTAESYSLDIRRGILTLRHLRVTDANGNAIVQLGSLGATGLEPLRGADQIIRVKGNNLVGNLIREPNGRFDIQDFLPEHKGPPGHVPFDITLDHCRVQYVDRTGPTEWSHWGDAPRVLVSGVGQDWLATAQVHIPGCGQIDARVVNRRDSGLLISGSTKRLELSPVIAHFFQTPESRSLGTLSHFSCSSLVTQGPFTIRINSDHRLDIEARLQATALNAHYHQYAADSAHFDGLIDTQSATGTLELQGYQTRASFQGVGRWAPHLGIAGNLSIGALDSKSLPTWARSYLPKETSFDGGRFVGWVSANSNTDYRAIGDLSASVVRYRNEQIDSAAVAIDLTPKAMSAHIKNAFYDQQEISGGFALNRVLGAITGMASSKRLDIGKVATRFGYRQIEGSAAVSATFSGPVSDPHVAFMARGNGQATLGSHRISLGRFEGVGSFSKGNLQLDRAYFDTPKGLLTAHGALGRSGNLGISVVGRGLQLSAYDPKVTGAANLEANVTGTLKDPVAKGRIEGVRSIVRRPDVACRGIQLRSGPLACGAR